MNRTIKSTFLLALLYFFVLNIQAQDDRDFRIGFKIIPGINWTKSVTSNVLKNGSGIGFSFGMMADIKLADNYFFTPEINITSMSNRMKLKGDSVYHINSNTGYNNVTYKYSLKYIEIPLTFKFRTNESNGMRYWGQIGIAPGVLIGNQVTTAAKGVGNPDFPISEKYIANASENDKYDFNEHQDNINSFRASMILGLGIEYNLSGNTSFYTGLRFNNGFSDILNDKKSKLINNVLGLELGFFF